MNGDGVGGKEVGECDVYGEGGLGFIFFLLFWKNGFWFFFLVKYEVKLMLGKELVLV